MSSSGDGGTPCRYTLTLLDANNSRPWIDAGSWDVLPSVVHSHTKANSIHSIEEREREREKTLTQIGSVNRLEAGTFSMKTMESNKLDDSIGESESGSLSLSARRQITPSGQCAMIKQIRSNGSDALLC